MLFCPSASGTCHGDLLVDDLGGRSYQRHRGLVTTLNWYQVATWRQPFDAPFLLLTYVQYNGNVYQDRRGLVMSGGALPTFQASFA